jgi:DNA repair exonuclease SbcCD ATPase subunit
MLLQRIRLQGFLGHRAPAGPDGDGFVDIDLRSSPLWLIHGPNGGGKSSLWDAVTFALFKRHRGGARNFERLIHDAADEAVVEVYVELREQPQPRQYRILSKITKSTPKKTRAGKKPDEKGQRAKRKEDSAKTWNIVEWLNGEAWESVPGTTCKAEEWVQRRLGMSYETFVCAVLLRQGEADAFIKADPVKRKARLLELLQLGFYEELGKKTNERNRYWKGQRDKLEDALKRLAQPTEEELEAQRHLIAENEAKRSRTAAALDEKARALSDAQQAEGLLQQIESVEQRRRADESLLERSDAIEADASLYRELKDVTRAIADLWEVRRVLDAESRSPEESETKAAEMEARSGALAESLEQSRAAFGNAEAAVADVVARLEQATGQLRATERQAEELEQIEFIEREIRDAEEGLEPYLPTLRRREHIQREFERHAELGEGLRLLKDLTGATGRLEAARGRFSDAQAEVSQCEEEEQRGAEEEERLRRAADTLASECEELRSESSARSLELALLRDKLEARNKVSGKDECPTCGSTLDEEAKGRIEHERAHWAEDAARLAGEVSRLEELSTEKRHAHESARSERSAAAESVVAFRLATERARTNSAHAADEVRRAESEAEKAKADAGPWAKQLSGLPELEREFSSLAGAPEEHRKLLGAQQVESGVLSTIEAQRRQLKRLPHWSSNERERIRAAAEQCRQTVSACEHERDTAKAALEAARAAVNKVETKRVRLDGELNAERDRAADLSRRRDEARAKYEGKRAELPPPYASHPACSDESALGELNDRLDSLRRAEEEEGKLREARSRQEELETTLADLRSRLENIPPEHRRPAAEVETERDAAKAVLRRADEELQGAKEELLRLEEQDRVARARREEFDEAEREFGYFHLLAEALGHSGLRARVVQTAQERISSHANTILGRLSNGEWQVKLPPVSDDELEIHARNLAQPGARPRPFEYLSGGEKFRVAVSLAIAIGQSVLGERYVDTLVIDEGFGSLDESNRDLMAKEMGHLSEEVLRGGRVIIVSHLDDVRGDFACRYRISKDPAGGVEVARSN